MKSDGLVHKKTENGKPLCEVAGLVPVDLHIQKAVASGSGRWKVTCPKCLEAAKPTTLKGRLYTFKEKLPKRQFLWFLGDDVYRSTLDSLKGGALAGFWRYEVEGEPGVYPTIDEWKKVHPEGGCFPFCRLCARAGYDPLTGKTK